MKRLCAFFIVGVGFFTVHAMEKSGAKTEVLFQAIKSYPIRIICPKEAQSLIEELKKEGYDAQRVSPRPDEQIIPLAEVVQAVTQETKSSQGLLVKYPIRIQCSTRLEEAALEPVIKELVGQGYDVRSFRVGAVMSPEAMVIPTRIIGSQAEADAYKTDEMFIAVCAEGDQRVFSHLPNHFRLNVIPQTDSLLPVGDVKATAIDLISQIRKCYSSSREKHLSLPVRIDCRSQEVKTLLSPLVKELWENGYNVGLRSHLVAESIVVPLPTVIFSEQKEIDEYKPVQEGLFICLCMEGSTLNFPQEWSQRAFIVHLRQLPNSSIILAEKASVLAQKFLEQVQNYYGIALQKKAAFRELVFLVQDADETNYFQPLINHLRSKGYHIEILIEERRKFLYPLPDSLWIPFYRTGTRWEHDLVAITLRELRLDAPILLAAFSEADMINKTHFTNGFIRSSGQRATIGWEVSSKSGCPFLLKSLRT